MCSLNSGSENLDWESLPKELYYLCGPVEKFYPYYYDDVTTANARFEMTSDEMAELKQVGQKIKENHHFALINRWIDAQGDAAWSKTVACLYFSSDCWTCRIFLLNNRTKNERLSLIGWKI